MDGIVPQRTEVISLDSIPAPVENTKSVPVAEPSALVPVTPSAIGKDDSYETLFPEPVVAISAPPTWIWWSLLGAATIGLGTLGFNVANGKVSAWLSPASTPKSDSINSASTPIPLNSTASPTPQTTPAPVLVPTPTPQAVAVTSGTVRILNGTSAEGAATKVKATLVAAGFTVSSVGNAKSAYTTTTIYYQPGRIESAQAVAKALSKYTSTVQESAEITAPDSVLVVLGPAN